jgi:hypothetical protein
MGFEPFYWCMRGKEGGKVKENAPHASNYIALQKKSPMLVDQTDQLAGQGIASSNEEEILELTNGQPDDWLPEVRIERLMKKFKPIPIFWTVPPELWQEIATYMIDISPYELDNIVSNVDWVVPVWKWRRFYPENFLAWLWGDCRRVLGPPLVFNSWLQMLENREEWFRWEEIEGLVAEMHMAAARGSIMITSWNRGRIDKLIEQMHVTYWKAMVAWEGIFENELIMTKNQDLAGRPIKRIT